MPNVVINEALSYVFFMYKNENQKDLTRLVSNFYGADAISKAKTVLWEYYGASGHDALPKKEDRRKGTKSIKEKELEDILNAVKAIDEIYCDADELPTVFAAVSLVNLPSCKPDVSDDADIRHRVKCLELQMNEVLAKKISYSSAALPPPPVSATPRRQSTRNYPGQSIPVIKPNYHPPGSLLAYEATKNNVTENKIANMTAGVEVLANAAQSS